MGERQEFSNTENWHNRGYLPHYEAANKYQMITYRLADSLPQEVLDRLEKSLAGSADCQSAFTNNDYEAKKRKMIEFYLDQGMGSCVLKNEDCAKAVVDNWHYFDKKRYDLIAYVVMPNHVHLLIKTYEGYSLGELVKTWKSYSTRMIKKFLKSKEDADYQSALPGKENKIWQREYWDRFIRDEIHFQKSIAYILENPVKAGLVKNWQEWNWCFVCNSKG